MNYDYEVFPTVRGVSAYVSDAGYLVIEQEAEDHQEEDQVVMIPPAYIKAFVAAVHKAIKG